MPQGLPRWKTIAENKLLCGDSCILHPTLPREQRTIRASFLKELAVWLLTNNYVFPFKIYIRNAIIDGNLNLTRLGSSQRILPYLHLTNCILQGGADISWSYLRGIRLQQCVFAADPSKQPDALRAVNSSVASYVILRNCWFGPGMRVDLSRSAVGSELTVTNARATSTSDAASQPYLKPKEMLSILKSASKGAIELLCNGISVAGALRVVGGEFAPVSEDSTVVAMGFEAARVGGDVTMKTTVKGILSFEVARIENMLDIGSVVELPLEWANLESCPFPYAIRLNGANIKGECRIRPLPGSIDASDVSGTIGLIGASVGGELTLSVNIQGGLHNGIKRAIYARPLSVAQRFYIKPDDGRERVLIEGTCNFNEANVSNGVEIRKLVANGQFSLLSATIKGECRIQKSEFSSDGKEHSLDLSYASLSSNLSVLESNFSGSLALRNTSIPGKLEIMGGTFMTASDGYALECFMATIGIAEISSCTFIGIVGFAHTRLQTFNLGDILSGHKDKPTYIYGHLRLNQAKIEGAVRLQSCHLVNFEKLDLEIGAAQVSSMQAAFERRHISDTDRCFAADNAHLGSHFYVQLGDQSFGSFSLQHATTGTLDHNSDETELKQELSPGQKLDYSWGKPPLTQNEKLYSGVSLSLNGFRYQHNADRRFFNSKDAEGVYFRKTYLENRLFGNRITKRIFDGLPFYVAREIDWLYRQYPDRNPTYKNFFPQPYRQLASVLRDQGAIREADSIDVLRRILHNHRSGEHWFSNGAKRAYGALFGYGYSAPRAGATLFVLLLCSILFHFHYCDKLLIPDLYYIPGKELLAADNSITCTPQPTAKAKIASTNSIWDPKASMKMPHGKAASHKPVGGPPDEPSGSGITCTLMAKMPGYPKSTVSSDMPPGKKPLSGIVRPLMASADLILPAIHLGVEPTLAPSLGAIPRLIHILLQLLGWIVIPFTAITFSGFFREGKQ